MKSELQNNKAPLKFVAAIFAALILFTSGVAAGRFLTPGNSLSNLISAQNVNSPYLNGILQTIERYHLTGLPSEPELTYAAIKGVVAGLDDDYSTFYTPEEAKKYLEQIDSNYLGIGVQLEKQGGVGLVKRVFPGSPAEEAGILAGSQIRAVNGESVAKLDVNEIAERIRGEAGTKVKIRIALKGKEVQDIEIERREIELDNIEYLKVKDGGYILRVYRFTEGGDTEAGLDQPFINMWNRKIAELAKLDPKYIVIDLRGNPGGFVSAVQHAAEEFLTSGKVVMQEREKDRDPVIYRDSRTGKFEDIPLVVFVDADSASAAEIMAAALQDNERATIIGQKTTGKGVEQRLIDQEDGSLLLLVFRAWLTPLGKQINADSPIVPDVLLDDSSEVLQDSDLAEIAIQYLEN